MNFIDYYAVMGLEESASAADIKKTYRQLARKFHPDVSKEAEAEVKFKEIGEAYAVLGDKGKKAEYDELRKYRQQNNEYSIPPDWQHREGDAGFTHSDAEGFSDFFESIFRREHGQRQYAAANSNGEDIKYILPVTLEQAFSGGDKVISYNTVAYNDNGGRVQHENTLKVNIPKGVIPGQHLRLLGKGHPAIGEGKAGDLYLEIELLPHERFTVEGRNLIHILPAAPWELALGCVVQVPTVDGHVKLTIPKNSKPGQKLRIKGKGFPVTPAGDLYIVLQLKLPDVTNEQQRKAFEQLGQAFDYNPRSAGGVTP